MKTALPTMFSLPPRLSMDEYIEYVEESIKAVSKAHRIRQKELEEVITVPFSIRGIVKMKPDWPDC